MYIHTVHVRTYLQMLQHVKHGCHGEQLLTWPTLTVTGKGFKSSSKVTNIRG